MAGGRESGPTFTWEGFERGSVLQLLAHEWVRITDAIAVELGLFSPAEAEPFRQSVTAAVLTALASTDVDFDDSAQLLHSWHEARRRRELSPTPAWPTHPSTVAANVVCLVQRSGTGALP